jgi:hypothetical protein
MTTGRKLAETAAILISLGLITGSAAASGRVANERALAAQGSHGYYDLARACPLSLTLPSDQADLARVRAREFQAAYGEALKVQVVERPNRDGVRFSINLTNWDVLDPGMSAALLELSSGSIVI